MARAILVERLVGVAGMLAEVEILVVGAGPAGMCVAMQLAQFGVRARVVERNASRRFGSTALSINPSSMLCLEALGCRAEAVRSSQRVARATLFYLFTRYSAAEFRRIRGYDQAFFMLPNWETEAVLEQTLAPAGVTVEYGTTLTGLEHHAGGAPAALRNASGVESVELYHWALGCDGSKSAVRDALGTPLAHSDFGFDLLVADVRVDWRGPRREACYFVEDHGFRILIPLDGERHRVVVSVLRAPTRVRRAWQPCSGPWTFAWVSAPASASKT